jgi:hypothetical protein
VGLAGPGGLKARRDVSGGASTWAPVTKTVSPLPTIRRVRSSLGTMTKGEMPARVISGRVIVRVRR